MFCIDHRESDLIRCLEQREEKGNVNALPVGDIWVGRTDEEGEGGLVIERKSIRDFEASILDGRYREQKGRILAFCHERKAQPMYVLEGSWSSATGRLQKKALLKIANRLVLHYQIPVIHTASVQETAEVIQALLEQWKEDPTALQRTTELVKVSDGIHVQKKVNAMDPRQFGISCLAQCSGVSVKMAESIMDTFGTWTGIMAAAAKEIQEVKVGARRVGPAVAKRLWDLLHFQSNENQVHE
jgi:ERCC4-type nuclease